MIITLLNRVRAREETLRAKLRASLIQQKEADSHVARAPVMVRFVSNKVKILPLFPLLALSLSLSLSLSFLFHPPYRLNR